VIQIRAKYTIKFILCCSHVAGIAVFFIFGLIPNSEAQFNDLDLEEIRTTCSGIREIAVEGTTGTTTYENLQISTDAGDGLKIYDEGVLLSKIDDFSYKDYVGCVRDLADIFSRLQDSRDTSESGVPDWIDLAKVVTVYRNSFEFASPSEDGRSLGAFRAVEPIFGTRPPISDSFTQWQLNEYARSGIYSLNAIPRGNPITRRKRTNFGSSPTIAVSGAILDRFFDTRGKSGLLLSFFRYSTSNPRPSLIHNCDSSLNIFVNRDRRVWKHLSAICGEYFDETDTWDKFTFEIPTEGAEWMQIGFLYEVQNVKIAMPDAVYLLDDIHVSVVD